MNGMHKQTTQCHLGKTCNKCDNAFGQSGHLNTRKSNIILSNHMCVMYVTEVPVRSALLRYTLKYITQS